VTVSNWTRRAPGAARGVAVAVVPRWARGRASGPADGLSDQRAGAAAAQGETTADSLRRFGVIKLDARTVRICLEIRLINIGTGARVDRVPHAYYCGGLAPAGSCIEGALGRVARALAAGVTNRPRR